MVHLGFNVCLAVTTWFIYSTKCEFMEGEAGGRNYSRNDKFENHNMELKRPLVKKRKFEQDEVFKTKPNRQRTNNNSSYSSLCQTKLCEWQNNSRQIDSNIDTSTALMEHDAGSPQQIDSNTKRKMQFFDVTDRNADGYVSVKEYMKHNLALKYEATIIVHSFDRDGDGRISQQEFLMKSPHSIAVARRKRKQPSMRSLGKCTARVSSCVVSFVKTLLAKGGFHPCTHLKTYSRCIRLKLRVCGCGQREDRISMAKVSTSQSLEQACSWKRKRVHQKQSHNGIGRAHSRKCCPVRILRCSHKLIQAIISLKVRRKTLKRYHSCMRKKVRKCKPETRTSILKHNHRIITILLKRWDRVR